MAINTMLGPDGRLVVCRMRPVLESVEYPSGAVQKTDRVRAVGTGL